MAQFCQLETEPVSKKIKVQLSPKGYLYMLVECVWLKNMSQQEDAISENSFASSVTQSQDNNNDEKDLSGFENQLKRKIPEESQEFKFSYNHPAMQTVSKDQQKLDSIQEDHRSNNPFENDTYDKVISNPFENRQYNKMKDKYYPQDLNKYQHQQQQQQQCQPEEAKIEKCRSISFSNKAPPDQKVSNLQKQIFQEQNISLLKHKFLEYIASMEQNNTLQKLPQQQLLGCKRCQDLETNLQQSLKALGGCGDAEVMQILVQTKISLANSEYNNLSLQGQVFREQEKRKNLQTLLTCVQTQRDQLVESSMQVQPGQMTKLIQESRQSYAKFRASQASFQLPRAETSDNSIPSPALLHNGNFRSPNLVTPPQALSPQNSQLPQAKHQINQQYVANNKGWSKARHDKENQDIIGNNDQKTGFGDTQFRVGSHNKIRKQKLAPIRDLQEY